MSIQGFVVHNANPQMINLQIKKIVTQKILKCLQEGLSKGAILDDNKHC